MWVDYKPVDVEIDDDNTGILACTRNADWNEFDGCILALKCEIAMIKFIPIRISDTRKFLYYHHLKQYIAKVFNRSLRAFCFFFFFKIENRLTAIYI